MKLRAVFLTVLCSLAAGLVLAQEDPVARSRTLYGEAMEAREAGNHVQAASLLRQAVDLRPHHPTLIYTLAVELAASSDTARAVEALALLRDMGVALDEAELEPFAGLGEAASSVLEGFATNLDPVGESETACTFEASAYIPESVAIDPKTGDYYVGSVHQRVIMRVRNGKADAFATREDGLWSVFGLKVDPERNRLWACTSATANAEGVPEAERGRSGLLCWDLATGEQIGRHLLPEDTGEAWLGDLVIATDGTVYATDSVRNVIVALPEGGTLETRVADPRFASLQGLDLSEDQRTLFVADYSHGVWRVDLESGAATVLPYPERACLLGIDGLYRNGGELIAIQNGMSPHRIVRATLNEDSSAITEVHVLAANDPRWDEPTLGQVFDGAFYYVATSQWGLFNRDGSFREGAEFKNPLVLRLPL